MKLKKIFIKKNKISLLTPAGGCLQSKAMSVALWCAPHSPFDFDMLDTQSCSWVMA